MSPPSDFDHVVRALAAGDADGAERLARDALAKAEAAGDLDGVARMRLALLSLMRIRMDPAGEAREMREFEAAATAHPASAVEMACDLARARLMFEAKDPSGAVAALRRATLKQAWGIGGNLSGAVLADLMVAAARQRWTDPGLASEVTGSLLALVPPEMLGAAGSVLDASRDPDGAVAARKALEAKRAGRHSEAAWYYLASTTGSIREGDVRQGIQRLLDARGEAVASADPVAYSIAALLLFVLYVASGDPMNAVATAMRAKVSLEDLLGQGAGDDFKALLDLWRLAVGDEAFRAHIQAFIDARRSGALRC